MSHYKYDNDIKSYIFDKDLIRLLCFDKTPEELYDAFIKDDFLKIDDRMSIPFFAEIRDYKGAFEKDDPESKWLVKPVKGKDILMTEMAMVVYFLDFFTRTLSVPLIITKIDGVLYRATKTIIRAEQLSGANYTVYPELMEQLLLDIINRWIFFDEDRNPNNYLIKYNSRNQNLILAIDFGNCDLLYEDMKIKGLSKQFGWQRKEKTRYLTPLKSDHFMSYDMTFYNTRFKSFRKLNSDFLLDVAERGLRFNPDRDNYSKTIASNILRRTNYVFKYFSSKMTAKMEESTNHSTMGRTLQNI